MSFKLIEFVKRSTVHCKRCVGTRGLRQMSTTSQEGGGGGDEVAAEGEGGGGGGAWPRRVLTGLQPTGALHVGNYFGCVRHLLRAQDRGDDLMVFIADLHALTTHQGASSESEGISERSLSLAALLLAAGLDPARAVLWPQSAVARHCELAWALTCVASRARLEALPQYRERAQAGHADRMGALMYPVLQAADILLYRATHVPVGADQAQHLQLAAALVKSFHHRYGGGVFPTPRPLLPQDGSDRVRSLRAPDRKMSKSDADRKASLLLTDSDDDIRLKIRKAVTDCEPRVAWEPERRPGVANLVRLHCLAADLTPEEAVEESAHLTTAQYKGVVAEALVGALGPVRRRARELLARPAALRAVLRDGAARARARADDTWECVAGRLGLASLTPPPAVHRAPAAPVPAPAPAAPQRPNKINARSS